MHRDKCAAYTGWLSACALAWWCLNLAIAASPEPIVVVKSLDARPYDEALAGFRAAIISQGIQRGIKDYTLQDGQDGAQILTDILRHGPSPIVTFGSAATTLLQTRVKDQPIIFCMVLNPVASGFVPSMDAPGRNVTGASLDIPPSLQFEAFKAVVPHVKRIGVLYNPRETGQVVEPAIKAAAQVGLDLIAYGISSTGQVRKALDNLRRDIDALWSVADSTVFSSDRSIELLLRQTLQDKLPFMGLSPAFVKAGALLALSVDYRDVGAQCAEQTAQVLSGRGPASLPITTPRRVTLYLNTNVARAIGVEIPSQTMAEAVILR